MTVIMPLYNREEYVEKTLTSIFEQKTDFTFQVIVADDCSTDNSLDIVKKFKEKYPTRITILESKRNRMLYKNVIKAYAITNTEYFCVLDPDDFWVDDFKIQKALTFLEAHKEYTIYATRTWMLGHDNKLVSINNGDLADTDFSHYLDRTAQLGHTAGSIFRNVVFKNGLPEKMKNLSEQYKESSFRGDSFRNILHIHEGKAHFVPDIDGVYRITPDGLWQKSSILKQKLITCYFYYDMFHYYDRKYKELLVTSMSLFVHFKQTMVEELAKLSQEEKIEIMPDILDIEAKLNKFIVYE